MWRSRLAMRVRVLGLSGECFALEHPCETAIWELKSVLRALRGTPRRRQRLLVGQKVAGAAETLGSFSGDSVVVTLVQSEPACAFCGARTDALRRCSGCNDVYYCGPLCQSFHWARHKLTCRSRSARHVPKSQITKRSATAPPVLQP